VPERSKTIAELHATLETTLKKHGEHPGLGFVLGDEVSLTPNGDPFDLCRCGSARRSGRSTRSRTSCRSARR
jgi:hypothetical protein